MILYQVLVPALGALAGVGIIFFISVIVAPYRQRNEARNYAISLLSQEKDLSKELTPLQKIRSFISEGHSLQKQCVLRDVEPPRLLVENWGLRVQSYLTYDYGADRANMWRTHFSKASPKIQFTGSAAILQIQLWNAVTAGIEKLEEFENELVMDSRNEK